MKGSSTEKCQVSRTEANAVPRAVSYTRENDYCNEFPVNPGVNYVRVAIADIRWQNIFVTAGGKTLELSVDGVIIVPVWKNGPEPQNREPIIIRNVPPERY